MDGNEGDFLGGATSSAGQYRFNDLNQRSLKNAAGVSTRFVYGPSGELLYEANSTGLARAHVWFAGELVALAQNGQMYAVYSDHLARPRKVLDSTLTTPMARAGTPSAARLTAPCAPTPWRAA